MGNMCSKLNIYNNILLYWQKTDKIEKYLTDYGRRITHLYKCYIIYQPFK